MHAYEKERRKNSLKVLQHFKGDFVGLSDQISKECFLVPMKSTETKYLSTAHDLYSGELAVKYAFWELLLYIEVLHNFCIPWGVGLFWHVSTSLSFVSPTWTDV